MTSRPELAVRCDGGAAIGAGHVARCLPLARAFAGLGWEPVFRGAFDGLAAWMIERAGLPVGDPDGVAGARAAIVDSYALGAADVCALAASLPVATIGEAVRCPDAGAWIDYHADRAGEDATDRLLPGPAYAPVDPRFADAGAPGDAVRTALVTVGASAAAQDRIPRLADELRTAFPGVRLLVAGGAALAGEDVERLPFPGSLLDVVGRVDLAVTGAGMTAYELAAAGVPMLLVQIADNQRRVVDGMTAAGAAATTLQELVDPAARARLRARAQALVDGRGAARAARRLDAAWR